MNRVCAVALAAAFSAYAGPAIAEPLTFNAALERASADAPSLRGRAASVKAAQDAAVAADRLPDPTLDVGIQDFPVTGPDAGTLNRDNFTMQKSRYQPAIREPGQAPCARRAGVCGDWHC
jgi:hypothetical protein